MAHKELDVYLAKVQSTLGTAETGLTNTEFAAFDDAASMSPVVEFQEFDYASGTFGQAQSLRGKAHVPITMKIPVIPTGTSTEPLVGSWLKSCGFEVVTATALHTYSPSSTPANWKQMTVWKYSGQKASGEALLTKGHNAMFNCVLSWKLGECLWCEFSGDSVMTAAPAAASYVSGALSLPSIPPAVIKTTTMTILGATLKCTEFRLDFGNQVVLIPDGSQDYGYYAADIGKRLSKFTAKVVMESHATYNPFTNLLAGTLATSTITFGQGSNLKVTISSTSKCEITNATPSDEGGILMYDLEGQFVDNSYSLAVNVA